MVEESSDPEFSATPLLNRHQSWLAFNERVLSLSSDPALPLLERLRFLSIWSTNLDEFFQVRVAGLKSDLDQGGAVSADGKSTARQLLEVGEQVRTQYRRIAESYKAIKRELGSEGITISKWSKLSKDEQEYLKREFTERVFPVLTPLAVDPGHPFPYISSLSLSIGVLVLDPRTGRRRFARIKVPTDLLGRYMRIPNRLALIPLEQVIGAHLDQLFPGMEVMEWAAFRITRDADQPIDDREAGDLLEAVETQLARRRFGDVVRLELFHKTSQAIGALLVEELGIAESDVYYVKGLIDLGSGAGFEVVDRPELGLQRWEPKVPTWLRDEDGPRDLFALLRRRDVLVHHPYVSFDASVLELIRQAASDSAVQAIKLTLYRTAGDGRIVDALIRAADSGKQVVVVVELKARFDEERNIEWARRLERSGVHVTYGIVGLKVHGKALLVVRSEIDGLRRYGHIGTGNYNAKTANYYTDFGLLTANPAITNDLSMVFNSLTGFGLPPDYERLIVAPETLRPRLQALIRREATRGSSGRIFAKMNSLVDPAMIEELYAASRAGVQIDLVVRGMCTLVPGLEGVSENIRVRSILGRYLEHSRLYVFGNGTGEGQPLYLMGSADLMPRNLDRRVELLVPVDDPALRAQLDAAISLNLRSDRQTWELTSTGDWDKVVDEGRCNPQHENAARVFDLDGADLPETPHTADDADEGVVLELVDTGGAVDTGADGDDLTGDLTDDTMDDRPLAQ